MHIRGGHFLQEDIAHFDAPFFNFSSDVAAVRTSSYELFLLRTDVLYVQALDPQFRLQLESVYESLENGRQHTCLRDASFASVYKRTHSFADGS